MDLIPDLTDRSKNGVGIQIINTIPDYISETYPEFTDFISELFKWADENPFLSSRKLLNNIDPDESTSPYLGYLGKKYLHKIPNKLHIGRDLLIKLVRNLYEAKGSESAYRFLFRILYDKDVDFYYPREDLLIPSYSTYKKQISIRVKLIEGNIDNLVGKTITGQNSGNSGVIDSILKIQEGIYKVYEFFLEEKSITGDFETQEYVTVNSNIFKVYSCVSSISIDFAGIGYAEGESIIVSGGSGFGALAQITATGSLGEIKRISILSPGAGYSQGSTPTATINTIAGSSGTLSVNLGAMCYYDGFYVTNQSILSTPSCHPIDSDFYQWFSYAIKVSEDIVNYEKTVKEILHPAGLKLFGIYSSLSKFEDIVELGENVNDSQNTKLVSVSKASVQSTISLSDYTIKTKRNSKIEDNAFTLGRNLRSIERDKFKYLPNEENYIDPPNILGNNAGYWGAYANTPNTVFDQYSFDDFINTLYKQTRITLDSIIYTKPYETLYTPIPLMELLGYPATIDIS